ncbi:MAG: TatD family hydrolase, partial [Promethearchaeota archaeon]
MYFDTHCHLTLFKNIPSIISKAKVHSVEYILAVSMYYNDNWDVLKIAKKNSEVIPALGIHPIDTPNLSDLKQKLETIKNLLFEKKIHTIGEIGLDHYYIKEHYWKKQEIILRYFLELA